VIYDEICEILDSLLFYQKNVSPAMWQTFEHLYAAFKGDGVDYIDGGRGPPGLAGPRHSSRTQR
jgi:hypothetical protein